MNRCTFTLPTASGRAKYWLKPDVVLASSVGFKAKDIKKAKQLIQSNLKIIEEKWNEFDARRKIHNYAVTEVTFDADYFSLHLLDGRVLSVPYEIVPSLVRATDKQRRNCEVGGMGTSLHWPEIDEDLTVEGLILGRRIIDWQKNLKRRETS